MLIFTLTCGNQAGNGTIAFWLYINIGCIFCGRTPALNVVCSFPHILFWLEGVEFILLLSFFFSADLGQALKGAGPHFDWASVTEVTKRGMSVMVSSLVSVFGSMIVLGVNFVLFALPSFVSMMNGGRLMSETPLNVGMICTSLIFAGIGAILFSDTVRRGVVI